MDLAIFSDLVNDKELAEAGYTFNFQEPEILTVSDVTAHRHGKRFPIFLDGKQAHKNRKDKDALIRQILASRETTEPLSYEYTAYSKKKRECIFRMVKEFLLSP